MTKDTSPRQIVAGMFGKFCAELVEYGFSADDIVRALSVSIKGMQTFSSDHEESASEALKRMGFDVINVPSPDGTDSFVVRNSKGECACPACVARRAESAAYDSVGDTK